MKRILISLFVSLLYASTIFSQSQAEINFLQKPPIVDGILDDGLSNLPIREFSKVDKSDKNNPDIHANFRLAYTYEYLYVFVEIESDQVNMRDRGFQNGDGLALVVANPKSNASPSDEFYVLGFSPQTKAEQLWQKQVFLYKNSDMVLNFMRTCKFAYTTQSGKTYYEILIPWKEIHPCHPWFMKNMGLNLCFYKAIGDKQVNEYYLKYDKDIQSERSTRYYSTFSFQKPELHDDFQWFAMLSQNNISKQDTLYFQVAGVSSKKDSDQVSLYIQYGEGERASARLINLNLNKDVSVQQFPVRTTELGAGGYSLKWFGNKFSVQGDNGLSILPQVDFMKISIQIEKLKSKLSEGSITTLKYHLKNITEYKRKLKPYETAAYYRVILSNFIELLDAAIKGKDIIADKIGIQRRAFTSNIDTTIQPYSIKIPNSFNKTKKYPLMVYIHNGNEDDRTVLKNNSVNYGNFIELAPYARGTSSYYMADSSIIDINEAISDVKKNYPIDSSCIILNGLGLGSYGAYVAFIGNASVYKGMALYSGNMNETGKTFGKDFPDFSQIKDMKIYKGKYIFIYHEKSDKNYPFAMVLSLVERLKKAGAIVDFYSDENAKGDVTQFMASKYLEWLDKISPKP